MVQITTNLEPRWYELLPGVKVKARPATTPIMLAGVQELRKHETDAEREAGFASAVARMAIVDWDGVTDTNGAKASVTPENVTALLNNYRVYLAFTGKYIDPAWAELKQLDAEKNGSAPAPNGTSEAGSNTAATAPTSDTRAETKAKAKA